MKKWTIGTAVLCGLLMIASVQGAIVHRYAMNDPNDSVGTANGVLVKGNVAGTSGFAGGLLELAGGGTSGDATTDYFDLPNGIISALGTQATFETWTTWKSGGNWARIFDFGTSDNGENTSNGGGEDSRYFFLTPQRGDATGTMRFGMNMPVVLPDYPARVENVVDSSQGILPVNAEQHVVVTYDEVNQDVRLFLNGVQVGQGVMPAGFTMAAMTDNNNWLGRAQYLDPMYGGSYNEFRIYNHAMSPSEVQASLLAGTEITLASPVSPLNLTKEVSRTPTLQWAAGFIPADYTDKAFRLYLSKTQADVANGAAAALKGEFTTTTYTVAAQLDTDSTYYWRVDEKFKKPGMTDPNYANGGVWSFDTIKTLPILSGATMAYALLGQSATLNVNIQSGSNVVNVSWYKFVDGTNDTLLAAGDKYAMTFSNTLASLTISGIVAEDGGKYYAKVQNGAGIQTSSQITVLARKGLAHRYSFDQPSTPGDPNVIDSVGAKNGQLIIRTPANNTRYENGMLILGNTGQSSNSGAGDYVDLPNGMISALGNLATFETWFTWRGPTGNYWQRVFDFGNSDGGENVSNSGNNTYYVMLTPLGGWGTLRTGYKRGAPAAVSEQVVDRPDGIADWSHGELIHVAVVWDGQAGVIKLYYNGIFQAQNNLHFALSDMNDVNNWLGRAQWNDALFRGSYDEFRIYDIPLDDNAILASYQAGPNVTGATKTCTAKPAGDLNGDCKVTVEDLAMMAANWLLCGGTICQ